MRGKVTLRWSVSMPTRMRGSAMACMTVVGVSAFGTRGWGCGCGWGAVEQAARGRQTTKRRFMRLWSGGGPAAPLDRAGRARRGLGLGRGCRRAGGEEKANDEKALHAFVECGAHAAALTAAAWPPH